MKGKHKKLKQMSAKIRLQRHGKKHQAFFHIVVADGRAPQQGKFIEKIGTYNPKTNPATIDINFEKAMQWLQKGAQPTDTARAILSYKGIMYKSHLMRGVVKKALTPEQAEAKFAKWLAEKDEKISGKKTNVEATKKDTYKKRLDAEAEAKAKKAAKIAAKVAPPVEEKKEATAVAEETKAETPVVEETKQETPPPAIEETKTEAPAAENTNPETPQA